MRENFDFVTMNDYQADTKEIAARSSQIITVMRKRAEDAERALVAVLLKTGPVRLCEDTLQDLDRQSNLTVTFCPSDGSVTLSATPVG